MRRFLALFVAIVAVAVGIAPAASAHGAESALSVVAAEDLGTGMHYRIRVVYQNDGEPVPNVMLNAFAVGPDGVEAAPVTFVPADTVGEYEGTVALPAPGAWTVRFEVAEPEGALTVTDQELAPTTIPPIPPIPPIATAAPTAPAAPATSAAPTVATPSSDDHDESSGGGIVVVAALAAAVVMGVVVVSARRRRETPERNAADR